MNQWFFNGKQNKIEKLIYSLFFAFKSKYKESLIFYFFEILEKIKPIIGLKLYKNNSRKVKKSDATTMLLQITSQYKKAIFWLSRAIKLRKEKSLSTKIYNEFVDILFNNTGFALKKKKEHYKLTVLFKTRRKFKW